MNAFIWIIATLNIISAIMGITLIWRQHKTGTLSDRLVTFLLLAGNLLLGGTAIISYWQWKPMDRLPELIVSIGILVIFSQRILKSYQLPRI